MYSKCIQRHNQEQWNIALKHFDANVFIKDLNNVPWNVVDNEENIDDALFIWKRLFSDIADKHTPIKRC